MKAIFKRQLLAFLSAMLMGIMAHAATNKTDATTSSTYPIFQRSEPGQFKPHIGIQLGMADSGSNYDGVAQYGIEVGYQPYIPLATAIELTTSKNNGQNESQLERTNLMAKGTYNFGGEGFLVKYSFVGAAIGPVFDTAGNNETNLGVKVLAGLDIPLTSSGLTHSKSFTLGAAANYLSVVNAVDTFSVDGQLKYWF